MIENRIKKIIRSVARVRQKIRPNRKYLYFVTFKNLLQYNYKY